ncbi:MAG: M20 family metallopeptidase [Firmicutes bacterium]|nr:M20 family metallopeptidase [Bacillota bacterium]MDY5857098.1 M20 family metallopeptidase [Anaerovoracaceae bacterium]
MEKKVKQLVEQNFDEIVAIRRDFHQHPELSEHEERTMQKISDYLTAWGIPNQTHIGGHGVVGIIEGKKTEKSSGKYEAVGIRADIDALPIQEEVDCPFRSVNDGVMHACGHDIHAAMLLGSAKILKKLENEFSGSVKLFFQPAEETVGGANQMIQEGCMEDPQVGAVIAFHVAPYLPTGTIEFRRGKMNAATCDLQIEVEGVSCHGAHPEGGVDAIVAGAQIVTALQSIISRNLSPTNSGIITVGQFHGGTKDNIVAGSAHLSGTIRALDPETMKTLKRRVTETAEGIAAGFGAKAHVQLTDGYPSLINSDEICSEMEALAEELLGREMMHFMPEPSLGADDFAYFTQRCDGLYMNVGTNSGKEEKPQKIHSEFYHPDENAMKNGILMEVLGALRLLEK